MGGDGVSGGGGWAAGGRLNPNVEIVGTSHESKKCQPYT